MQAYQNSIVKGLCQATWEASGGRGLVWWDILWCGKRRWFNRKLSVSYYVCQVIQRTEPGSEDSWME